MDRLVSLLLLIFLGAPLASSRQDVVAQFYKLYQQRTSLTPLPALPDPLPDRILNRLRGRAIGELSVALQRALLWDAGLLPVSASSASSAFVSIKVPCGNTMSDIFLARDTVSNRANCPLVTCNAEMLHFATSTCSAADVVLQTKCGVVPPADPTKGPSSSSNPLWMQESELDSEPYFQVFRHGNTSATSIYTIQEKPQLRLTDDAASCPNKPSFIIPCRRLEGSDATSSNTWCDPTSSALVDLWIREEVRARRGSNASSGGGGNGNGDEDTIDPKKHADTSTGTNTLAIIFIALFGVALAIVVFLGLRLRELRGELGANTADRHSVGEDDALVFTPRSTTHQHQALMTPGQLSTVRSTLTSNSPAHQRPSVKNTAIGTATTSSGIEKINAEYCRQSHEIAEFCEDPELLLRRITFADLDFLSQLARGANGEVWRGVYAGQPVAIKRLLRDKREDVRSIEVFAREIRLASSLEHTNVVRFMGMSWRALTELCMISEFMPAGDLAHFLLAKESRHLSWEKEKLSLALDIANALVYLHSLVPVIIHRDLKSLNVLLSDKLEGKLSDFGLSRERTFEETMTSGVGTLLWTAPEVLRGDRYSEKADIYSYGVVLSELDTSLPPYSLNDEVARAKHKHAQLLPLIRSGQIKPRFRASVPPALHELALACLDIDPDKRPNAMQIVYTLSSKVKATLIRDD